MNLPVPPCQVRNVFSNRDEWADYVEESVLLWKRRLTNLDPDKVLYVLRASRNDLEKRVERLEGRAEEVLNKATDLAREIASYANLDEEESVRRLRHIVLEVPRELPLTLDSEPVDLWEARGVFSEAAPGDRKQIKRLVKRHSRFRKKVQQEKYSRRIVEYVHGLYLNRACMPDDVREERDLHPTPGEEKSAVEITAEVFDGKSRSEGAKTSVDDEVIQWAVDSHERFLKKGDSSERAKDKVLGIAENHGYHFTRRTLERHL